MFRSTPLRPKNAQSSFWVGRWVGQKEGRRTSTVIAALKPKSAPDKLKWDEDGYEEEESLCVQKGKKERKDT